MTMLTNPTSLECWVEKSTQNDILRPLCERYGANLVVGMGTLSITAVVAMLNRLRAFASAGTGKKLRVIYVSDYDGAGQTMPAQIARQCEFWVEKEFPGLDVKLNPVALTQEQILKHKLPTIPIKETLKGTSFAQNNDGAVELDALEGIVPGELGRIVEAAMKEFHDRNLKAKFTREAARAQEVVSEAWQEVSMDARDEFDALHRDVTAVVDQFQHRIAALADEFDEAIAPMVTRRSDLDYRIYELANGIDHDYRQPVSDVRPRDDDWLFSTDRDYYTQIEYYHRHRPPAKRNHKKPKK